MTATATRQSILGAALEWPQFAHMSGRLEAGQCPTCGARLTIEPVDFYGDVHEMGVCHEHPGMIVGWRLFVPTTGAVWVEKVEATTQEATTQEEQPWHVQGMRSTT